MRRRSAISWTSIVADEDVADVATPAPLGPVSPPHDWAALLGPVRDQLAALARAPAIRADPEASAILLDLDETQDLEALDRILDALRARADAMVREHAGRFRPQSPFAPPDGRDIRVPATAGGRRILRL